MDGKRDSFQLGTSRTVLTVTAGVSHTYDPERIRRREVMEGTLAHTKRGN